jgi:hypothetical protein
MRRRHRRAGQFEAHEGHLPFGVPLPSRGAFILSGPVGLAIGKSCDLFKGIRQRDCHEFSSRLIHHSLLCRLV